MSDLNTIALGFGVLLTLKKVADLERCYYLRLFVIITVLCSLTILLFLGHIIRLAASDLSNCTPID